MFSLNQWLPWFFYESAKGCTLINSSLPCDLKEWSQVISFISLYWQPLRHPLKYCKWKSSFGSGYCTCILDLPLVLTPLNNFGDRIVVWIVVNVQHLQLYNVGFRGEKKAVLV